MPDEVLSFLFLVTAIAIPVVVAITFHEAAHGFAAWKLGDDTALRLGRVSFNPLRHVDPFGTVLLPGMLVLGQYLVGTWPPFVIGWAKPVPVDFLRLRDPRWGMVWVALAGPGVNLVLAFASALALHAADGAGGMGWEWVTTLLFYSLFINTVLMLFNMIPLPPLDGGRVLVGVLPAAAARAVARTERFGLLILITLVVFLPLIGSQLGRDWSILPEILLPAVEWTMDAVLRAAGH
jgi:Zn-dependent protease